MNNQQSTDWIDLSESEMDRVIAQLEIEMEEEMKSSKPDTGFRSLYNPKTGEMWEPRPFRVHASTPPKKRFRDSFFYFFLLVLSIGLCLYALAWLITVGAQ